MISPDRESYNVLQVDRPIISGADAFLARVADIGERVMGSIAATSLPELVLLGSENEVEHLQHGEPTTTLRTLQKSRIDVFSETDLKMILLRRVVPTDMSSSYKFNHKAARFEETRSPSPKKRSQKSLQIKGKSITQEMDAISAKHGLDPKDTGLLCDSITTINDPQWGLGLALTPKTGSKASRVLAEQEHRAFKFLKEQSPKSAYDSNPWMPSIPFVSLPDDIEDAEFERFSDMITDPDSKILPVRVVMGGVAAYSPRVMGKRS